MAEQSLPSVREHADAIISRLIEENGIKADPDAARQAAAVPTFSAGTAAIDPNTGRPIFHPAQAEEPEFVGEQISIPEGTETTGGTEPAPASKEAILAAHRSRVAGEAAEAAAEPVGAVASQEAGAQAAEAAAEAIAEEYDEYEFEDPDLEVKVPIKFPKRFAETVKRGYGRRAALDRAIRYATNAEPVLRQMIETGQIQQILPLLQRAVTDPQYGEYVTKGYQRLQQGLPLIEQARQEAEAAAQTATAYQEPVYDPTIADPFVAEQIAPIQRDLSELRAWKEAQEQERQRQAHLARQQQAQQAQLVQQMQEAHQDLARAYPDRARLDLGAQDPFFDRALRQAREAGYVDAYGPRAGIVFGAQMAMQIEAERLAATGSTAAATLNQIESQRQGLARQQAAAASRTVGSGAVAHAPAPAPPPRPNPRNPDGTLKNAANYLREVMAYQAAGGT